MKNRDLTEISMSLSISLSNLMLLFVINGVFYTFYNFASFLVLSRTNLVTHAVLNVCRRVVIILFTSYYFQVYI